MSGCPLNREAVQPHGSIGPQTDNLLFRETRSPDLRGIFFFGCTTWHIGFKFHNQGWNLHPLQWKCGVLTTLNQESPRGVAIKSNVLSALAPPTLVTLTPKPLCSRPRTQV